MNVQLQELLNVILMHYWNLFCSLFFLCVIHKALSKILIAWLAILILGLFFLCGIKSKSDLILKGCKECWIWHWERK